MFKHRFIVKEIDLLMHAIMDKKESDVKTMLESLDEQERLQIIQSCPSESPDYLFMAIDHGCEKIAKLLIDFYADVNLTRPGGDNALHAAASGLVPSSDSDYIGIFNYLIERGVDVNQRNIHNNTPLGTLFDTRYRLSDFERKSAVLALLAAGAQISWELWKVKSMLGNEMPPLIIVGTNPKNTVQPNIYRQMAPDGTPIKTYQERRQECFRNHPKTSALVTQSLFKENQGAIDVLHEQGLTDYLTRKAIGHAAEVSAVRNNQNEVINSSELKTADEDAKSQAKIGMKMGNH